MLNILKQRLALTNKGAKDFCKGVFCTTLLNIALMLPAVYVFLFLEDYLRPILNTSATTSNSLWYYVFLSVIFMIIMWVIARFQYRSTFTTIYEESANRRISLAEKLRKLPLAFFGEKNLSDLTSTIMDDCTELEHTFSHAVPQLCASIISLILIFTGLFFYNWQLSLALFWVIPLAAAIILIAKKTLHKENQITYDKKRNVTEQIQEGLNTIQEIKSYNQEDTYLDKLDENLNIYEKYLTKGELLSLIHI